MLKLSVHSAQDVSSATIHTSHNHAIVEMVSFSRKTNTVTALNLYNSYPFNFISTDALRALRTVTRTLKHGAAALVSMITSFLSPPLDASDGLRDGSPLRLLLLGSAT